MHQYQNNITSLYRSFMKDKFEHLSAMFSRKVKFIYILMLSLPLTVSHLTPEYPYVHHKCSHRSWFHLCMWREIYKDYLHAEINS